MGTPFDSLNDALEKFKNDDEFTNQIKLHARWLYSGIIEYENEVENMYDDRRGNHDGYDSFSRERNLNSMLETIRNHRRFVVELFANKGVELDFYECDEPKFL